MGVASWSSCVLMHQELQFLTAEVLPIGLLNVHASEISTHEAKSCEAVYITSSG
jgi:hypothetical protein